MMPAQRAFRRGRHVLVTGHTGFNGSWLSLMLERLGARVSGIAMPYWDHGRGSITTHLMSEQPSLTLDATLGRQALGWQSRRNALQTIAETVAWYSSEQAGTAMRPVSLSAIDEELAA